MLGDLLAQIRTTLQDTDVTSGTYRYSTDSIVANINMGMIEMYRFRPDIFLANKREINHLRMKTCAHSGQPASFGARVPCGVSPQASDVRVLRGFA